MARRKKFRSPWLRPFKLVDGPHHGEVYRPVRTGKGLPSLISRECTCWGIDGKPAICRSTYSFDEGSRVYRFRTQQVS